MEIKGNGWHIAIAVGAWIWAGALGLALSPASGRELRSLPQSIPQTRLTFSPFTVGTVIAGAGDRIYILRAQRGDVLSIDIHSLGARAGVIFYDANGKEVKQLFVARADGEPELTYTIPKTGDYALLCYSGPTFHFYDLTVRID